MKKSRDCPSPSLWNVSPNRMRISRLLRMSRRDTLLTGMGAALTAGLSTASAQDKPAAPASDTQDTQRVRQFMELSSRLTDRPELDTRIGTALYAGIISSNADRARQIADLADLLHSGSFASAADFARAAEKQNAASRDVIHDILTGWYRGIANKKVVVYRSALMFDLTKDAVYPKTYAAGGPFYWTTKPPEVERPLGHPALTPEKFIPEPT